jgi:hypothetical protein
MRMNSGAILIILGIGLIGCASEEQKLTDAGDHQLTGAQITQLFSNAHEGYESRDQRWSLTAVANWTPTGRCAPTGSRATTRER